MTLFLSFHLEVISRLSDVPGARPAEVTVKADADGQSPRTPETPTANGVQHNGVEHKSSQPPLSKPTAKQKPSASRSARSAPAKKKSAPAAQQLSIASFFSRKPQVPAAEQAQGGSHQGHSQQSNDQPAEQNAYSPIAAGQNEYEAELVGQSIQQTLISSHVATAEEMNEGRHEVPKEVALRQLGTFTSGRGPSVGVSNALIEKRKGSFRMASGEVARADGTAATADASPNGTPANGKALGKKSQSERQGASDPVCQCWLDSFPYADSALATCYFSIGMRRGHQYALAAS